MAVSAAGFTKAMPYRHASVKEKSTPQRASATAGMAKLYRPSGLGCQCIAAAFLCESYEHCINQNQPKSKKQKKQNHCTFVLYIELKRTRCSGSLQLKFIYFFYIFTTVATKGNPLHWCPITAGACGKNSRESNSFSGQSCECDSKYTTASYLLLEAMEPFHDEGLLCNHLCELWHLESFRYISLAGPRALACHTFQSAMSSMKVIESSESQLHFTTCNGANKHHKRKHTVWWNSA